MSSGPPSPRGLPSVAGYRKGAELVLPRGPRPYRPRVDREGQRLPVGPGPSLTGRVHPLDAIYRDTPAQNAASMLRHGQTAGRRHHPVFPGEALHEQEEPEARRGRVTGRSRRRRRRNVPVDFSDVADGEDEISLRDLPDIPGE